ncbi:hypothetical protein [Amycolatopsis sp. lyj-346]|uniref:hypothetical protein n=1 Tax=Amycolatopsis sp. lyj-346 TaxID=2789289 RepID=UPI00397A9F89
MRPDATLARRTSRSEIGEERKRRLTSPVVPESALKATLGILERTVRRRLAER